MNFNKLVWSSATPLQQWEPTMHKLAILIFLGVVSSIKDRTEVFKKFPGYFF